MLGKVEMIMNQSIYDVWVMKFCEEKLSTGNEYVDLDVLNYYCSSMKGEYSDAMDCGIEFPSVCNLILEKYSDIVDRDEDYIIYCRKEGIVPNLRAGICDFEKICEKHTSIGKLNEDFEFNFVKFKD
jgi:hypothetical protein